MNVDRPKVGIVDIGTNSMRLLITDGEAEDGRWVEITGLGQGVDATGEFSRSAMERTLDVLARYGRQMNVMDVEERYAMATSASRDASNREELFDRVEALLGVRPELISGVREGVLAFDGATCDFEVTDPVVVTDIGGGSTEFVTYDSGISIDMGSVRLTERLLPDRPPSESSLELARAHVLEEFADASPGNVATHIGVAGTWTSLAAIAGGRPAYDRSNTHGYVLVNDELDRVLHHLATLTVEETGAIPSLDPKRAPVILAGAVIASVITEVLEVGETLISEKDTLDGAAMELLGL